jgi:hypothetical protein
MSMGHWWNNNWQGTTEVLEEKHVPVPFFTPYNFF